MLQLILRAFKRIDILLTQSVYRHGHALTTYQAPGAQRRFIRDVPPKPITAGPTRHVARI